MQADRLRRFGILGGGVFFSITGLAQPFFTLYAQELGASTWAIGLLVTLRALAPIVIAMPAGQLIDMLGPMRMLGYGMMLLIISLALTALASDTWMLVLSQLFLGASIIICASALQVLVSTGDPAARNEAINRYSMWMSGGSVIGPLLGGLVVSLFHDSLAGHRAAFAAAALAGSAFLLMLILLSRRYPHQRSEAGVGSVREVFSVGGIIDSYRWGFGLTHHRSVRFGLSATFIIMYIQSFYFSFLPLLLDHMGYSTMLISLVLVAQGLASMTSRFVLGGVMKRASLPTILTAAGFVASVCLLLTPLAGPSAAAVVIVVSVMGAAVGLNLPVSLMIMVDAVGENERGKLMGLRLLVNRFAQILSPAMFGAVGGAFGLSAAFSGGGVFLLGAMCGFSAVLGRGRLEKR
jgi:MFS family permease